MDKEEIFDQFPVILYADGACCANGSKRAIGGYAYVLLWESMRKEFWYSNFEQPATNNRMEMRSILSGLETIKYRWHSPYPKIAVISDSKYCINGASDWMYRWERKGWKKSEKLGKKNSLANADLWKSMFELCRIPHPSFFWVKGHSGDKYNEICDSLSETSIYFRQEYFKNVRNSITGD